MNRCGKMPTLLRVALSLTCVLTGLANAQDAPAAQGLPAAPQTTAAQPSSAQPPPPQSAAAQPDAFARRLAEANRLRQRGNYADAEKLYAASLAEAETFGERDLRLAKSLNNLAVLHHIQGRYAQAEPLYLR